CVSHNSCGYFDFW
nr:immunoglobulin heavy chain junction region [Macaca mulatta]